MSPKIKCYNPVRVSRINTQSHHSYLQWLCRTNLDLPLPDSYSPPFSYGGLTLSLALSFVFHCCSPLWPVNLLSQRLMLRKLLWDLMAGLLPVASCVPGRGAQVLLQVGFLHRSAPLWWFTYDLMGDATLRTSQTSFKDPQAQQLIFDEANLLGEGPAIWESS